MNEVTSEKANQLLKMFQFLGTRGYKLYYEDNSFSEKNGIQYITQPCSFQYFVLKDDKNKNIAELKQQNGLFYFRE
jgi:hypothetical protein